MAHNTIKEMKEILDANPKKDDVSRKLAFRNPSIHYRTGKPEWGAEPNKLYFVITWEE